MHSNTQRQRSGGTQRQPSLFRNGTFPANNARRKNSKHTKINNIVNREAQATVITRFFLGAQTVAGKPSLRGWVTETLCGMGATVPRTLEVPLLNNIATNCYFLLATVVRLFHICSVHQVCYSIVSLVWYRTAEGVLTPRAYYSCIA